MRDVRALAARTLCIGVEGTTAEDPSLTTVRALRPGGVVLFSRNIVDAAQTAAYVAAVRDALGDASPFLAVDQEGGRVARVRDGVVALPSAMAFGASGDVALAERAAERLGHDLRALGITVNFAPVADLALDARNTVVGTRAFGDDSQRVGAFVAAFVRGLERGGVGAVVKHVPGHGATAVDSHLALPVLAVDAVTFAARERVPFAAAIAAGARALMTAHVVVPFLDASEPATLSPTVLQTLVRDELGFTGLLVTDDLEMGAIAAIGVPEAAVRALVAGADLVLICHDHALAFATVDAIVAAVADGRLSEERLREAVARGDAYRVGLPAGAMGASDERVGIEAAAAGIAVVRGDARVPDGVPISVLDFDGVTVDGVIGAHDASPSLNAALRLRRRKSEVLRIALDPDDDDLDLLFSVMGSLSARAYVAVVRRAAEYPAQREAIERLLAFSPDALVACVREPHDALLFPQARNIVCTFGDGRVTIDALADAIVGRAVATGRVPLAAFADVAHR